MTRANDPAALLTPVGHLSVLFVIAAEQEFGPELREQIFALVTGVGPVEAGIRTAAVLGVLQARGQLPDLVFSLGTAGSRTLDHAGIYQVASVSYRDMDATPLGFARGVTPFLGQPSRIDLPLRLPGIPAASISTGAQIVSGSRYDGIDADMVDMETYAVLRAAEAHGLPLIGLRGISDGRGELTGLGDWTAYLREIDAKLAATLRGFEEDVKSGRFHL
ncbi:MAG TPA: 5'-methylthioadenosine/S-adenosylhomocysteine nucleosidase [Bauldia sp.]|nr:5'-methylthioadenosine/S-adenosylhomocysteine nucleosidase [Bauldia sp.]